MEDAAAPDATTDTEASAKDETWGTDAPSAALREIAMQAGPPRARVEIPKRQDAFARHPRHLPANSGQPALHAAWRLTGRITRVTGNAGTT